MSVDRRRFLKMGSGVIAGLGPLSGLTACATSRNTSLRKTKVLIIGAGLAGLNCARLLQEAGLEPVVLEAASKAGGRTRSATVDGININLGGIEIGDGYQRYVSLAKSFGLEFYDPAPRTRELTIYRNGKLINGQDWSTSEDNPLPDELRALVPSKLQFDFHRDTFPLKSASDWLSEEVSSYDVAESERLKMLGASPEALNLINIATNSNNLETVSSLHYLRGVANIRFGGSTKTIRLSGGNDQLALKLSNETNQLNTGHQVESISESENGIKVSCSNGSQWLAEKVVIAIPFSVLRNIPFSLDLPALQQRAINELPYTQTSKLVMRVEKPFWEQDGLPANMWCDSNLERTFLSRAENGDQLYSVFINGDGTKYVDSLPDDQAAQWVLSELHKTRPSTAGAVKPLVYKSWGNDPLARGAYHAFAPGQINAFASEMVQPTSRVFFAGEHCSRSTIGMEGALESGETTAGQIMASLGK